MKRAISIISLVICILFYGCVNDKKNEEIDKPPSIVVSREGVMSIGENTYKIYSARLEMSEEIKSVKLYYDDKLSDEGIFPTSVKEKTAVYDKNILVPGDGSIKELIFKVEDIKNTCIIIKSGV